jgi:hypothetical protein
VLNWVILTLSTVLGLLTASAAFGQACPNKTTLDALQLNLTAAEEAFAELDVELFSRSMEDLSLKLPCVRDLVPPKVAARYHRVLGISLYANGEEIEAFQALRAARVLDTEYSFPAGMFPPGHELVVRFQGIDLKERSQGRVLGARDLTIHFDGTTTRKRPSRRATLLQMSTPDGSVLSTRFMQPADTMPKYETRPRLRKPIIIATGIATGLAAAFYGGAMISNAEFNKDNPNYEREDLEKLRRQTHALVGVSAGFAGLAIGGGITIAIVSDR